MYDRRHLHNMLGQQILGKTRNSPNSPNIIARQNLLIYSIRLPEVKEVTADVLHFYMSMYKWAIFDTKTDLQQKALEFIVQNKANIKLSGSLFI